VSGHEILKNLVKLTGVNPVVKADPAKLRPSDTPVIYGSNQKIAKRTGWQPEISLSQTLADVIDDWQNKN
jgi:GDP-4-dehydro-6-deoxy-D-mannose reductase